jgi:two-component system LytT family response regulator
MILFQEYRASKIAIPTSKGSEFIDIKEIIRIEADRSYSWIFLTSGRKIMVSRNLSEYEELLAGHNFFRAHNSHLVNLLQVKAYVRGNGGYIEMNDTSIVPIARQRREAFLEMMQSICL